MQTSPNTTSPAPGFVTKQLRQNISEASLFLQEWFRQPQQIGSIAPSSKNLGLAMARWLSPDPRDLVLELGPGTGAITSTLLARGVRPDRLIAIEQSPKLAELLAKRFPEIRIITGDAQEMDQLLHRHAAGARQVGTVISSLPLRQFKDEFTALLAGKIRSLLRPGGCWVQYSYHLGKSRHRGAEQFHLLSADIVWLNLPPARVSVYQNNCAAS